MTKPHVIVVGAGIGGSASAALPAHAGFRVPCWRRPAASAVPVPAMKHAASGSTSEMSTAPRAVTHAMRLLTRVVTADDRFTDTWPHRDPEDFVRSRTDDPTIANAFHFIAGPGFVLPLREISAEEALHRTGRVLPDTSLSYVEGGSRAVPTAYYRLDADIVVSTSSVRTTALRLCDPATLPPAFADQAKGITVPRSPSRRSSD